MTFISDLLEMTGEAECPESFVRWAGLVSIAAVVKRNVWIDRGGYYRLYPNIYVFLVGDPGLRKSFAPSLTENLVSKVGNTRVFAGRQSVESIMEDLSKPHTTKEGMITESSGVIASEEFAAAIIKNPQSFTVLTDLYSFYRENYDYKTRYGGHKRLQKVSLSIIGAINPAHFEDIIEERDLKGGFLGRFLVIFEKKKRVINPLTRQPKIRLDFESLAKQLKEISLLKGEISYSPEALELFEEWYKEHNISIETAEFEDTTGSQSRVHDTILKAAQLLTLDEQEMVISRENMQRAIDLCLESTRTIQKTSFSSSDKTKTDPQKLKIVMKKIYLSEGHRIGRKALLKQVWNYMNVYDMDNAIDTLEQGGVIKVERGGNEGSIYKMVDEMADKFKRFMGN